MTPYAKMIDRLKVEEAKRKKADFRFDNFLGFETHSDYTDFTAALAYFEEYDLLKRR